MTDGDFLGNMIGAGIGLAVIDRISRPRVVNVYRTRKRRKKRK
jgi:hypothetical protein